MALYDDPSPVLCSPGAGGRAQLQRELDRSVRDTTAGPPGSAKELRLDALRQQTQTGFRYNSQAFMQVCRACAPGLSRVVLNLAGEGRVGEADRVLFSIPAACQIFNSVVDLRFEALLSNHTLIADARRRQLEGFLGPRTLYMDNNDLVDLFEGVVVQEAEAEFYGASIHGRRLFLRYLCPQSVATPAGPVQPGFALLANDGGDEAIRTYWMFLHKELDATWLAPAVVEKGRRKRTGEKFHVRLRRLFASLLVPPNFNLSRNISRLLASPLFPQQDEDERRRCYRLWVRRLRLAGLPADLSANLVHKAAGETGWRTDVRGVQRTEYAIFEQLCLATRTVPIGLREAVERAIHSVFFTLEA